MSAASTLHQTHLHHAGARVEEDAAFGFLGDLLVFVEVHDVGVVRQLGELKVSPLERLRGKRKKKGRHGRFIASGALTLG